MVNQFLNFFLLNNLFLFFILSFPYPWKREIYSSDFNKRKLYFLKKTLDNINEPESVFVYLNKFLKISDFEDSVKVLPLFLLSGIELKKIEISKYEKYMKYFKPEYSKLITLFNNLEKKFFYEYSKEDTFLYYLYLVNAINFKKNIELEFFKEEPELIYLYSFMKYNAGKLKEAEKFINKFISEKENYFHPLFDDALYLKSIIERLKGNYVKEEEILLRLKNEFPVSPYRYEVFLRLITIYFENRRFEKIIELKDEVMPFFERIFPYFYYAYVFVGNFNSAEKIIKKFEIEKKRDSLRYEVIKTLIKEKKYDEAYLLSEFIEDKKNETFFETRLKILFLKNDKDEILTLFDKEKDEIKKGKIAKVLGDLFLKEENYDESERFYSYSYEKLKDDKILYSLLFVKLKAGKIDKGTFYVNFLKSASDTSLIKSVRMDFHFYLKENEKFKEAEQNLISLISMEKNFEKVKFLIDELYEIERFVKNDSLFLGILKKFKDSKLSGFALYKAINYMIERNFKEDEIFSYASAFEIKEGDEYERKVLFELAKLYLKENKVGEAKVLLKELAFQSDSLSYKSLLILGDIAINEINISLLDTVIFLITENFSLNDPYYFYFMAERERLRGNKEKALLFYQKAAENFKEDRNSAARMLLKAALISEPEKKDYFFKRALILAEDKKLREEIEDLWKKEGRGF